MKKNLNRVLTIIVPVLLLVVLSTSIGAAERKAPSFQLNGLNGKTYTLDDFRGRPVVIAFFDTNCGFCKKELPLLDKLYKTYQKSTALQVIGIDILDNGEDVQRMTSQMELSCLILLDETGKTMSDYRVPGIPTTFFIDPQGNMADYIIGATTEKKIHEKLDRIFWYQGLRDVEIQNLLEVASQIDLLDFRASAQNPYADRNNVKYIPVENLDEKIPFLEAERIYLVLSDSDEKNLEICQKLVLNEFKRLYFPIGTNEE